MNPLKENLSKADTGEDVHLPEIRPKHSARATVKWFRSKNILVLERPSQSPDLEPKKNGKLLPTNVLYPT